MKLDDPDRHTSPSFDLSYQLLECRHEIWKKFVKNLATLGWNSHWQKRWDDAMNGSDSTAGVPGRIICVEKDWDVVETETDILQCERRLGMYDRKQEPAIGDWVAVQNQESAFIQKIITRGNTIKRRRSASGDVRKQIIAANIDIVLITFGLDTGVNANRLVRSLVIALDAGTRPLLILSKADTVDDNHSAEAIATAKAIDPTLTCLPISSTTGEGVETLVDELGDCSTSVVVGASGAGKSTLINYLYGADIQATKEVRASDNRGRHTTTKKQLLKLAHGNTIIDTPGVRSLGLWQAAFGVDTFFADVVALSEECRFRGCSHSHEPKCAVKKAVEEGNLSAERLVLYQQLHSEIEENLAEEERIRRSRW